MRTPLLLVQVLPEGRLPDRAGRSRVPKAPRFQQGDLPKAPLFRKIATRRGCDQVNQFNPWWTNPSWALGDDLHLAAAQVAAALAPFRRHARPFDPDDLSSRAAFTLRGLRRSG